MSLFLSFTLVIALMSDMSESSNKIVTQKIHNEIVRFDYADFEDLQNNKSYDKFKVGSLNITTGKVVCTDPMYRALGYPQSWTVNPGNYPVSIYIGLVGEFKGRVAYAEVIFSDEPPVKWEYSLISNKYLSDDFEKMMNGTYPVENGLSSLSDYETWKSYNEKIKIFYSKNKEGNYYRDVLEPQFKANSNIPPSSRGEDWINFTIDEKSKANIIMFGSGWGDGLYPRYVAYDKNGRPVKFITDFINQIKE